MTGRPQCIGVEEAGLVRECDGLHTVAEPELLQDVRDMRLHRRRIAVHSAQTVFLAMFVLTLVA